MLILGIETSCDETSASVVKDGKKVLSNIIASQIKFHRKFGGVVPEIASRKHTEYIIPVIDEALSKAKIRLSDIELVSVTIGPGLIGSLLVGIEVAKAISFTKNIPIVGVNHLEAHLYSCFIEHNISFPVIGIIISGGHTELVVWKGHRRFKLIARTRDDAAGEAFDKVSKILGYSYPGGPVIEKLANLKGKSEFNFPKVKMKDKSMDFSFSGLKTAVLYSKKKIKDKSQIANAFQDAVVISVVERVVKSIKKTGIKTVLLTGGVACNLTLRKSLQKDVKKIKGNLIYPSPELCGDNAAMVGVAGYYNFKEGMIDDLSITASSNLRIC